MTIRFFRYAALLLGTVGLGLLYLMTINKETPLLKIDEIKPTMNFAYVRIAGTVSSDARFFKEGDKIRSMRFMVDDGTGEISVTAYRSQAQELQERNLQTLELFTGTISRHWKNNPSPPVAPAPLSQKIFVFCRPSIISGKK